MNCWVIFHCLSVSCTKMNHSICVLVIWSLQPPNSELLYNNSLPELICFLNNKQKRCWSATHRPMNWLSENLVSHISIENTDHDQPHTLIYVLTDLYLSCPYINNQRRSWSAAHIPIQWLTWTWVVHILTDNWDPDQPHTDQYSDWPGPKLSIY